MCHQNSMIFHIACMEEEGAFPETFIDRKKFDEASYYLLPRGSSFR